MKKLLALTAMTLVLGVASASAQEAPAGGPGHDGPGGRGEKMFERLDANSDGSVSKEEFLKVQEEHFAKMDANGDGQFTQDEAKAMKEKMREMRKQHEEEKKGDAPADTPAPATPPSEDKPAQ